MILLLICPKCRNKMKYQSQDRIISRKRKTCVYCGRSFSVSENVIKKV